MTTQNLVFISYARKDHKDEGKAPDCLPQRLYQALKAEDFTPWLDWHDLPSRGPRFPRELQAAIEQATHFIAVCGPHYPASDWSQAEREHANRYCLPIIPVLSAGDFADSLPDGIGLNNCIDMRSDFDTCWPNLLKRLQEERAPLGFHRGDPIRLPPPGALPRTELVDRIRDTIRPDDSLPVVISGQSRDAHTALHAPGGLGKTVLASIVAFDCDLRWGFPDGIVWITVGKQATPESLCVKIGLAFGRRADKMDSLAALTALLQDMDCLIIFDDVWDYAVIRDCMVPGPDIRYLVTTRSSAIASQFPKDNRIRLGYLKPEEGADLIAGRLGLDANPYRDIHLKIAVKLGGHTGAIAIAAARLDPDRDGPDYASELLRRLEQGKNIFSKLMKVGDEREENLEKMLSLSYDDLSDDLKRRFRLLGVFAETGTFDEGAAAAVWGDEDPDDAHDALVELTGLALVERSESGRYNLHSLTRLYALELLKHGQEDEDAHKRHADYYFEIARNVGKDWHKVDQEDVNIAHAAEQFCDRLGQPVIDVLGTPKSPKDAPDIDIKIAEATMAMAMSIRKYVELRRVQAGRRWLQAGLAVARLLGDTEQVSLFLNELGVWHHNFSQPEEALSYLYQSASIDEDLDNWNKLATTLNNIAGVYLTIGNPGKALECIQLAQPIFEKVGDQAKLAILFSNIGMTDKATGQIDKAIASYEQARLILKDKGDWIELATVLNNIGTVHQIAKQPGQALKYYQQAWKIYEEFNDRSGLATTLTNSGSAYQALDQLEEALKCFNHASKIFEEINDRSGLAATLNNIGEIFEKSGQINNALEHYERALAIVREMNAAQYIAVGLYNIAKLQIANERKKEAVARLEEALNIMEQSNLKYDGANQHIDQYRVTLSQVLSWRRLSNEQVNRILSTTANVVLDTTLERRLEWLRKLDCSVKEARSNEDVDEEGLFIALIRLIREGNSATESITPSVPKVYRDAWDAFVAQLQSGRNLNNEQINQLLNNTAAVLISAVDQQEAWLETLDDLAKQASTANDPDTAGFAEALSRLVREGAGAADTITSDVPAPYRAAWDSLLERLRSDNEE